MWSLNKLWLSLATYIGESFNHKLVFLSEIASSYISVAIYNLTVLLIILQTPYVCRTHHITTQGHHQKPRYNTSHILPLRYQSLNYALPLMLGHL